MPVYEYHCDKCDREVTLTLSIREHEKGEIKCPKCGGESLRPLLSAFVSDIEEILIPNLGDVNLTGVEVSSALVLRLEPDAQFNDAAWSSSSSASTGITHRANTTPHGHNTVSR